VRDSDGTLVLLCGAPSGGTALTLELARRYRRPCLRVDLEGADPASVRGWLARHRIRVLNVAGPRESERPGVERRACAFLERVLGGSPGR
jgi:hypothetical protein